MQIALTVKCRQDEDLIFAQQLGVNHIVAEAERWDVETLTAMHNRVEKAGLELVAIENLPQTLYGKAILGLPGRDEEIEEVCQAIWSAGIAGIPLVSYRWTPPGIRRTQGIPKGRGDAIISGYDHTLAQQASPSLVCPVTAEAMWRNLTYFLERIIPVAEESGVRMACHPDDPPIPSLGGVARILHNVEGLTRLLETTRSSYQGLDFCLGTLATMPRVDVMETIREFGLREKIFLVHLRNPRGALPSFSDAFLDEGDIEMVKVLRTFQSVGFVGPIRAAQPPRMVGDSAWGHKGRAFDVGYLRALLLK